MNETVCRTARRDALVHVSIGGVAREETVVAGQAAHEAIVTGVARLNLAMIPTMISVSEFLIRGAVGRGGAD